MTCTDPRFAVEWIGPNTAPGRMVASLVDPGFPAMKSHAARSATVFGLRYVMSAGSFGSVHGDSSVTLSCAYDDGLAAFAADVITTRSAPAAVDARSTRRAPSRAGTISASASREFPFPKGEPTWST